MIFHRVLARRDPLQPTEPTATEFERRMRLVRSWFNVLPLREAVDRLKEGTLPERPLCITFDDGYADNLNIAQPILERLGLPAAFFIATAYLDGGRMFNDTIVEAIRCFEGTHLDLEADGLGRYPMNTIEDRVAAVQALIGRVKYLDPDSRQRMVERVAHCAPLSLPDNLMLQSGQVRTLARPPFSVGAHTDTHPILTRITEHEAALEMRVSRSRLQELTDSAVELFAYPNGIPGRDYDSRHARLVAEAGFVAAVSTGSGAAAYGADVYQLPRFTPWGGAHRMPLQFASNLRNVRDVAPSAQA